MKSVKKTLALFDSDKMCFGCAEVMCNVCRAPTNGKRAECGHYLCDKHIQNGWVRWGLRSLGWALTAGYYFQDTPTDCDRHLRACKRTDARGLPEMR